MVAYRLRVRSIIVITVGLTALLGACSQEGETSGQGSSVPPGGQVASTGMAGIKQNGILGWLLRGSWLTSSEYLV